MQCETCDYKVCYICQGTEIKTIIINKPRNILHPPLSPHPSNKREQIIIIIIIYFNTYILAI